MLSCFYSLRNRGLFVMWTHYTQSGPTVEHTSLGNREPLVIAKVSEYGSNSHLKQRMDP